MILRNERSINRARIFSRLNWQKPQSPKSEPIGIGSLGYHISLSEQDDLIHITFRAEPLRSDTDTIIDHMELNINFPFDEKHITSAIKDIKEHLFKAFPDPENYFNKIEPIQEVHESKTLSIACDEIRNVHMTKEYLDEAFKTMIELLEDIIRNPQTQQRFSFCTIS